MAQWNLVPLTLLIGWTAFATLTRDGLAQDARRGLGGPIVLNPDDVPAMPDPPLGIDVKREGVPHVWHVDGNGHDPVHWKNNLYHFTQRIFR
jgi:hypothetical protein